MLNKTYATIFVLLFLTAAFGVLHLWDNPKTDIPYYLISLIPIYLVYLLFVFVSIKHPESIKLPLYVFIIAAIVIRFIVMPGAVTLSDDIYRYLWDGKISAEGINPYSYAPEEEQLKHLRDTDIYPKINFPNIATVYPPLAQFFFLLNVFIGNSILSWKIILFLCEAGLTYILYLLIRQFSLNPYRLLIFMFNPLLIIETYQSGHLDLIGVSLFWMAIFLFYRKESTSILFFLGAALIKFYPLITAIPFLIKRFWTKILFILSCFALVTLPFSLTGAMPMSGLLSYLNRWAFNNIFYVGFTEFLSALGMKITEIFRAVINGRLEIFYMSPAQIYKAIVLVILVMVIIDQMQKLRKTADFLNISYLQSSFFITGLMLLLTPTLHPWYLLWIIPFLIFVPNWSWLAFTLLIQLSYVVLIDYARDSIWEESIWILLAQYIPFILLLTYEYIDRRKIRGWFLT
jgi:hypothetical protein